MVHAAPCDPNPCINGECFEDFAEEGDFRCECDPGFINLDGVCVAGLYFIFIQLHREFVYNK